MPELTDLEIAENLIDHITLPCRDPITGDSIGTGIYFTIIKDRLNGVLKLKDPTARKLLQTAIDIYTPSK